MLHSSSLWLKGQRSDASAEQMLIREWVPAEALQGQSCRKKGDKSDKLSGQDFSREIWFDFEDIFNYFEHFLSIQSAATGSFRRPFGPRRPPEMVREAERRQQTFPPRWEDWHTWNSRAQDLIHSICLDIGSIPAYLPQKVCSGCLCATGWGADQCWSKRLLRAHGLTKQWFVLCLAPYCAVKLIYPVGWVDAIRLLTSDLIMVSLLTYKSYVSTVWHFGVC